MAVPTNGWHPPGMVSPLVGDTVRYVAGGHMLSRAVDVVLRIIEEDVGTERLQERPLVAAAEEKRFGLSLIHI